VERYAIWMHEHARSVAIVGAIVVLAAAGAGAPAFRDLGSASSDFYDPNGQDVAAS
jgi:hypothetical protein